MTGTQTLLARTVLGCVAAAATVLLPRFGRAYTWSDGDFRKRYLLAFSGVRFLLFGFVFLLLRIAPRGDLPGIYVGELKAYLAGAVPYRDYASSYAPLFPYLYGPLYRLHPSALTIIACSILVEIATAVIFLRWMPRVVSESRARFAALLCLCNPISLQFVTVDGQNNVVIGLFLALALLWSTRKRAAWSGASLGMSIASVKFLPLLFFLVFPMFLRRGWLKWVAGCAAVVGLVYGTFAFALHAPVLQAAQREGEIKSAGGLPFLVETIAGRDLGRLGWDGLLLLALGAVLLLGWRLARRCEPESRAALAGAAFLLPALLLTVMALGKKTWPTYTEMVLFPLSMAVAVAATGRSGEFRRGAVWLVGVFSLLSVTAHSVWSSVLQQATAPRVHTLLRAGDAWAWAFLLLEIGLFSAYAALAGLCLRAAARFHTVDG